MNDSLAETLAADGLIGSKQFWQLKLVRLLFFQHDGSGCLAWIRLGKWCGLKNQKWAMRLCARTVRQRYQCYISMKALIGAGLELPHPTGIVIGDGAEIGPACVIYQSVTIGGARRGDWKRGFYPTLGRQVTCFAGAKILGKIHVGDYGTIGANAVVLQDVPENCSAVGIPARILNK